MSLTRAVPAAVPSLFHNSGPCVPSFAWKYSVPFALIRSRRDEPAPPGLMSLTSTMPAVVPSLGIERSLPQHEGGPDSAADRHEAGRTPAGVSRTDCSFGQHRRAPRMAQAE